MLLSGVVIAVSADTSAAATYPEEESYLLMAVANLKRWFMTDGPALFSAESSPLVLG